MSDRVKIEVKCNNCSAKLPFRVNQEGSEVKVFVEPNHDCTGKPRETVQQAAERGFRECKP